MKPLAAALLGSIDRAYADATSFLRLKARLLLLVAMGTTIAAPLNVLRLWLQEVPHLGVRIGFNVFLMLSAWLSGWLVWRGRLEAAGNTFALLVAVAVHVTPFVLGHWLLIEQPLSMLLQVFVMDSVLLLLAFGFCTHRVALAVAVLVGGGQMLLHYTIGEHDHLIGTLDFAADSLLRDGLTTLVVFVGLLFAIRVMVESSHQREEAALRRTRALADDLERQVAQRTQALEGAMKEAAAAARVKSDFLANMSHEIRTPLNGIVATADLMRRREGLSDAVTEDVRLISDSGELLLKLIDDILDFSKIEAGQMELEAHAFELKSVVADSVNLLAPRAVTGGVGLRWEVAAGLPARCTGDSFRLRQVLLNLLSNAVKFTRPEGHVTVRVVAGEAADAVRFEIADTGIGMDAVTLSRLFERFTQADSSTTRLYGGTGLGLAISARLVARMGGKLAAESEVSRGSRFFFTLQLPAAEEAVEVKATAANPENSIAELLVLVAEDNPVNLKIIGSQLKALGCRYAVATDGEEALVALQRSPLPDLVLLDCHMPRLDGWEVARRVRGWADDPSPQRRAAARLPIVALTAAALADERQRCLDAGMNDFLAKPARLADLERVLLANRRVATLADGATT